MRCPRCKTKITDDSVFCSECGCKLSPKEDEDVTIFICVLILFLALGLGTFGQLLLDKHDKEVEAELARRQAAERYEQQQNDSYVSEREETRDTSQMGEMVAPMDLDDYLAYGANNTFGNSTNKNTKEDDVDEKTTEYIIEDSASRYLTDSDVKGLTLQEINYAKNEIYARHGRRFKSKELQDYFDSTSWYVGKYSPEDFDQNYSERMLNDFEKRNADFLSEKEFSIAPNGYQLDAN